jgi:hypothetical protein
MDFLLGTVTTTLILFIFLVFLINKRNKREPFFLIRYSQSHIHRILSPLLPQVDQISKINNKDNQSSRHLKNTNVRVLIVEGKAYWTKNNVFYVSNIVDGDIDKNNAQVVDTMGMNKVELDKMFFIVQKLTEGKKNDGRGRGFKGL